MTEHEDTTTTGTDVPEEKLEAIRAAYGRIAALKDNRKSVQAQIQAEREGIEAMGLTKKAFDAVASYLAMDEDDRRDFDIGYKIIRQALGAPLQPELWDWKPANGEAPPEHPAEAQEKRPRGRPRKTMTSKGPLREHTDLN